MNALDAKADDTPREPPALAMPSRPARPLSALEVLKTIPDNSLGVFDDELYENLFVTRRYSLVTACFISDPAGVKQVLVDNFDNYPRVPTIRRLFEAEIGTGTLASEGETWRRHRRIATPAIDRRAVEPDGPALIRVAERRAKDLARRAAAGKPIDMERVAADMLARMLNHISTGGDDSALPMLRWLSTVPRKPRSIDMVPKPEWVSKFLVRRRLEDWKAEGDRKLRALIAERALPMLRWLSTVPRKPRSIDMVPKPEWVSKFLVRRRLEDWKAEGDRKLRALIAERRDPDWTGGQDLLWRLAHARDRQTGEPLSPEETRDEAASIIAAGDATIRALTWIWYLLDLHPHVESRMHAELDEVLGDRKLTPEDVSRVPYTKRVLDEVMRLYPPIPVIVRKAVKADVVCGRPVPRGAIVTVAPFLIHRHRQLWERPDVFDPDRFEDENRRKVARFAYIPFAAGPRVCPGASASTANLMFSIITLARQFRFRLASTEPITPFGGISLQPKGGLPMWVEKRK